SWPPRGPWPAWLPITAGLGLGLWAVATMRPGRFNVRPDPHPAGRLVTHGPYRWLRHPMYLSVLLVCGGLVWLPYHPLKLTAWLALALLLWGKARYEESLLCRRYREYQDYRAATGAFLPGPGSGRAGHHQDD
ncbi:MAG: isoprenylcysteine carboxylmethyltransferase family protein, partial [Gammaproteobacteria bacterium]